MAQFRGWGGRTLAAVIGISLLSFAVWRIPGALGGQGAVSLSRPGHEDLTFWANHNGLNKLDVEGEIGFGDAARILIRRRSNAPKMRALRDRFTFKTKNIADLGQVLLDQPTRVVLGEGGIYNLLQSGGRIGKIAGGEAGTFVQHGATVEVRPLVKLTVRLIDENGKPAAARIYLTGSDGLAYAPKGSISRIAAMPAEYYFHAENSFQMELPAGQTLIEATRGLEYELTEREVDLVPGRSAEVTLKLKRWENMARRGWYSADAHIHANYTAADHQVITPEDVRLQALAEDLNNANMMVANSFGAFIHDPALFEGKPHSLSGPNHLLYWNEEMRNAGLYGHMCFFNLKSLVHPLYTGFRDTPQADDYPPNYTQASGAQAQGGAVTYAHPGYEPTFEGASARELPADLALGRAVDAMDVLSNNFEPATTEIYHRLLNCGFRLAISAGTDAFTNVADHYTPGGGRVYVRTGGKQMNYAAWIQGYKQGRSFASNGPMISMTVDGKEPGEELQFPSGATRTVRVRTSVSSLVPVDKVDVIVNGKVAASRNGAGAMDERIPIEGSSWIAVRATGPWNRMILNDAGAYAHTSPVYVQVGGERLAVKEDVRFYIAWMEKLIARTKERGRFSTAARREEVVALFERALDYYKKLDR